MTYTSLQSPDQETYQYELRIAHLYGNLMNTYGDNGNILMESVPISSSILLITS